MDRQQQTTERDVTDRSEDGDTAANPDSPTEKERFRFYGRLLYGNAMVLAAFIAISFILPLSEAEHWTMSLVAAGLLGLNLAMIDEAHKRQRRYQSCDLDGDRTEDYSDPFIDF